MHSIFTPVHKAAGNPRRNWLKGWWRAPLTGQPFPGNAVPVSRFNSVARAVLPFYPKPNVGAGERFAAANFIENRPANIESDQFDIRLDHQFSARRWFFARYWKKSSPSSSPNVLLLPTDTIQDGYHSGVISYTWALRPNLLNEFRTGTNCYFNERQFPFDGRGFLKSLNLKDIPSNPIYNGIPAFLVDRITSFAESRPGFSRSLTTQFTDNMPWAPPGRFGESQRNPIWGLGSLSQKLFLGRRALPFGPGGAFFLDFGV